MKYTPIIMQPDSVRGTLDGTKTQTRRLVKPQPDEAFSVAYNPDGTVRDRRSYHWSWDRRRDGNRVDCPSPEMLECCPYGRVGDRLWVRERHAIYTDSVGRTPGSGC